MTREEMMVKFAPKRASKEQEFELAYTQIQESIKVAMKDGRSKINLYVGEKVLGPRPDYKMVELDEILMERLELRFRSDGFKTTRKDFSDTSGHKWLTVIWDF